MGRGKRRKGRQERDRWRRLENRLGLTAFIASAPMVWFFGFGLPSALQGTIITPVLAFVWFCAQWSLAFFVTLFLLFLFAVDTGTKSGASEPSDGDGGQAPKATPTTAQEPATPQVPDTPPAAPAVAAHVPAGPPPE